MNGTPEAGGKQPYYITTTDGSILRSSGFWDTWIDPATNQPVKSCPLMVTSANESMAAIHDRMPVFLQRDDADRWLPWQEEPTC